jgi:hypothetical protein
VYFAQLAGAAAVIIADNAPLCGSALDTAACNATACEEYCPSPGTLPSQYNPTNCECVLPFMGDDPSYDVSIPSLIVEEGAGSSMKECLQGMGGCSEGANVTVALTWGPAPANGIVHWELWQLSTLDSPVPVRLGALLGAAPPLYTHRPCAAIVPFVWSRIHSV